MLWEDEGKKILEQALSGLFPQENNRIDWKQDFSSKEDKPACHLSAFANYPKGGYLVFGIEDVTGKIIGLSTEKIKRIEQKITCAARDGLNSPIMLDIKFIEFKFKQLLFVKIFESRQQPVYLKGKSINFSYIRSGGETRKMTEEEIKNALMKSKRVKFESMNALKNVSPEDFPKFLDIEELSVLANDNKIKSSSLDLLKKSGIIKESRGTSDLYDITNLGALICGKNFQDFDLGPLTIRVIKYKGASKMTAVSEKKFAEGYAVGFQKIIDHILSLLSANEIIEEAFRKTVPIYPAVAIRELLANALIHQNLNRRAGNVLVEIFGDRIDITNPGTLLPSVHIDQLINTHPESRNEILAGEMKILGLCEERGSGIDRAVEAVELYGSPAIDFYQSENFFRARISAPKPYSDMSLEERISVCYQHCCLLHVANKKMTNTTLRERLKIKSHVTANRLIKSTLQNKKIKLGDPDNKAPKFTHYIPYWG